MPMKDVGFNPVVNVRRFFNIGVIFFFRKFDFLKIAVKSPSRQNQKSCCFSDLVLHSVNCSQVN